MWRYVRNDELYHYGILGMRWGVRRYQNKDGSLTPAGKKRAAKLAQKYRETVGSDIAPGIKTKRRIQDMSNDELVERTIRNRLENDYMRSLSDKKVLAKQAEPAMKKYVKETLLPNLTRSLSDALKEKTSKIIGDLWEEKIGPSIGMDKYTMDKAIKSARNKADLQKEMNRIIEEEARKRMYDEWRKDENWSKIYTDAFNKGNKKKKDDDDDD